MHKLMHTKIELMDNRVCIIVISECVLFFLQPLCIQGDAVLASDNFVHNSRGSYRMLGSVQNHPKPLKPSFGGSVYFFGGL